MYGNFVPSHPQPQPRSAMPSSTLFSSFQYTDTKKSASAPSNPNTSKYLDSKDYSKLEDMLHEDNVDEEYEHLNKQQIAKIQQSRAGEEKQKFLEKEKKAHQDANAYFKKIKEENIKLKKG